MELEGRWNVNVFICHVYSKTDIETSI
jgi:hypothetical protein